MFTATSKLSCTKNSLSLRNGPALPKLTVCQSVVTEEGNLPSHEMPSLYYQVLLSSGLVVGLVIQWDTLSHKTSITQSFLQIIKYLSSRYIDGLRAGILS